MCIYNAISVIDAHSLRRVGRVSRGLCMVPVMESETDASSSPFGVRPGEMIRQAWPAYWAIGSKAGLMDEDAKMMKEAARPR